MKNISEAKTIEEIAKIRRYKNETDKLNNDRSSKIISDLYSSSTFHSNMANVAKSFIAITKQHHLWFYL